MSAFSNFFVDVYDRKARAVPGLIAVIPYLVIVYILLGEMSIQAWMILCSRVAGIVLLLVIGVFGFAWLSQLIAIVLWEKRIFQGGLRFQTTQMLLHSDTCLSKQYKGRLRKKIETESHLRLMSSKAEKDDEYNALLRIKDAVKVVKLKTRQCPITKQYLISYGMSRNLLGASFIGIFASVVLIVLGKVILSSWTYVGIGVSLTLFYGIALVWSDKIIRLSSTRYAEKMFEDYMNVR